YAVSAARARPAGCPRTRAPPRPSRRPRRRRTSQTRFPSLQSRLMSTAPGLFRPPPPHNEPVRDYAPGPPEREELRVRLQQMQSARLVTALGSADEDLQT